MNKCSLFQSVLESSHTFYSAILLFGFGKCEKELLEECVSNMVTPDKVKRRKVKIQIYDTDEINDIYGIPYFMAFINFNGITEEDKASLLEFFNMCKEPMSSELTDSGFMEDDFENPVIYALNSKISDDIKLPACIKRNDSIFKNKVNLRLTILSNIKDIEGCGTSCTNAIRIYRVLQMYKCLVNEGSLTKQRVDELMGQDNVCERMFYKDMYIIREIEDGNLIYDKKLKEYKFIK